MRSQFQSVNAGVGTAVASFDCAPRRIGEKLEKLPRNANSGRNGAGNSNLPRLLIYVIGNGRPNTTGGNEQLRRILAYKLEFLPICANECNAGVAGTYLAA